MNAAGAERALIFAWERVRQVPLVLLGFLVISLVGHFGVFFLFRVIYPAQASLAMPPPVVTVLDPSRPDHQALLRWAEAEDPAPAAAQSGITERLLEVPYRPSYATVRTAPLMLPTEAGRAQYPPPRDPLTLIRSVEPKPAAPQPPPRTAPTRIAFSGELSHRMPNGTSLTFKTKSTDALEPAEFLVGVTDRGEVRFVILQRTSGNESLDAEASNQLTRLQLTKADAPITWAHAAVLWGADAYALPPSTFRLPPSQ
jgi:hypothetical protein